MFVEDAVDLLEERQMPPRLRALLKAGAGAGIGRYQWMELLLDFRRVAAANQMVSVTAGDETAISAEAAVLSRRYGISTRLAVNLAITRAEKTSLYLTEESGIRTVPPKVVEQLRLKMTPSGQAQRATEEVECAEN